MSRLAGLCLGAALLALGGCAQTYQTPGPKADLRPELKAATPADMQAEFDAKPTLRFPAHIVAMHVQGDGYGNYGLNRRGGAVGRGAYTVVTARDESEQAELEKLAQLPQVAGMISINRMLLPEQIGSERDLRAAAARLQADLVWFYTFDTRFFDHEQATPLKVISLGLLATHKVTVNTVASALLVDTRTGYVYAASEAAAEAQAMATAWGSQDSADEQRMRTEREAFTKLSAEFARSWPSLVKQHSGG